MNLKEMIVDGLKKALEESEITVHQKGDDIRVTVELFGITVLDQKIDILKDGFDQSLCL